MNYRILTIGSPEGGGGDLHAVLPGLLQGRTTVQSSVRKMAYTELET